MKTLGKSILFSGSLMVATSSFAQDHDHKHESVNKYDMHQGMEMSHVGAGWMLRDHHRGQGAHLLLVAERDGILSRIRGQSPSHAPEV